MKKEDSIRGPYHATPILRGTKITIFLLGVMFTTLLTSGILSRPTQAVFLNTVTQNVGCMLNIGTCPPPPTGDETPPVDTDDPDPTPTDDTTAPAVSLAADPLLAGGTVQTITITGTVSDDNLSIYSVAVNGNVAQSESNMTQTSASINIPWNVSTPNVVPSGTYLITLDVTDTAGNTAHNEISVEVDNTAPDVNVSGGDIIIKEGSISPTTAASDAHGIASYNWIADENNAGSIAYDNTAAEPSFTPTVEGAYTFYVSVADGLGNVTNDQFNFSYAQELERVPLPTTANPTESLIDKSPSTPAVVAASSNPTIRSGRDDMIIDEEASVLGNTTASAGIASPTQTIATIAPTPSGWSILGILWYWWGIMAAAVVAIWQFIKRRFRTGSTGSVPND